MNNEKTLQIRINQLEEEVQALRALKLNSSKTPYKSILIKHSDDNSIEILSDELITVAELTVMLTSGLLGLINSASKNDIKNKDQIKKQINNILKNDKFISVKFNNLLR
jgi:PBP1b-binding outer membrane lipoprotein LpoB